MSLNRLCNFATFDTPLLHSKLTMVDSCESKPKGVRTQRRRVFWKQNPLTARPKRDGGRWGVAQACNCRSILDAIATLIHAQRTDLAIIVIENELNSQT